MADVFKTIQIANPTAGVPLHQQLVGVIAASSGTVDAGKVVVTNANGQLDISLIPINLTATITATANTGSVLTVTAANTFTAGQMVTLNGLTTKTELNGKTVTILSTGLSSSQFEANYTDTAYSTTPDTGTATISGGSGSGTVTSFSAGNLSPLFSTGVATATTTPALSFSLSNAAQNAVFAGPASGGAGAPSYRALVVADIPSGLPYVPSSTPLPQTITAPSGEFLTAYNAATGLFTAGTPSSAVVSVFGRTGVVTAQSGDYSYSQISGTPTLAQNTPAISHEFIAAYNSTSGAFTQAQPAFSDLSGSISTGQIPAATVTVSQISATGTPSSTTYLRGDGSWSTVPSGAVTSVFGRTGAVIATSGDYTYSQISGTPQLAQTFGAVTNEFLTSYTASTGVFTAARPSFSNLSGSIATGQIPAATITVSQINATGTPSSTTYLRGDGSWATITSGGTVTQVNTSGIATGGPITTTGTVTVTGSSTNGKTTAVTDAGSITSGTSGDVVTCDGHGNVQDSGTLLSSLAPLQSPTFLGTVSITNVLNVAGTLKDSTGSVGTSGQVLSSTVTGVQWVTGGGSSVTFTNVTTGTNTTATMTVGSGASLTFSGSGVVNSNQLQGITISPTAPTTGQVLTATSSSAANWQTPSSSGVFNAFTELPITTSSRTAGTVYQNTTGGTVLAIVVTAPSGGQQAVGYVDSSATPTHVVCQRDAWHGPGGATTLFLMIPNNDYYEVILPSGGGISQWREFAIASGTITVAGDLGPSGANTRVAGTTYQNTSGSPMYVLASFTNCSATGGANPLKGITDSGSSPTTVVWEDDPPSSGTADYVLMPVLPGDYYIVSSAGNSGATLATWYEYTWTGVTMTRQQCNTGGFNTRYATSSSSAPTQVISNASGATRWVQVASGNSSGGDRFLGSNESFTYMCDQVTSGSVCDVWGLVLPGWLYVWNYNSGSGLGTSLWWEWTIS